MSLDTHLLQDLQDRGLVAQMTGESQLVEHLQTARALYCGFDPTADSLHIGSLVPLLALKRFQMAGHTPIVLLGGATGLIGDPSFKSTERKLNTVDVVANWVERLQQQVGRFVDFDSGSNPAVMVNNLDWVGSMNVLSFLRDVGKHFSINNMINKESVKQRIQREGEGISFTEFTYMLLQSYDFAELFHFHYCTLQIGGSDQWGNITGGVDLTRRLHGGQVFGLTLPLVTKSDGTKFGKTESGTVWLDPAKTSPYAFYQFWLNTADADVYRFLKYFTFLNVSDIDALEQSDRDRQGRPEAQKVLADEVTRLVHGEEGLQASKRITQALFSDQLEVLTLDDLEQLRLDGIPFSVLQSNVLSGQSFIQTLVDAGLASSGKPVKDALARGAISINGMVVGSDVGVEAELFFNADRALFARFYLLKMGKKNYHLFELAN